VRDPEPTDVEVESYTGVETPAGRNLIHRQVSRLVNLSACVASQPGRASLRAALPS